MSHNYSFVVLKHLIWNELTFLVTYNVIMNVSLEAAVGRCPSKKDVLKNFTIFKGNACVRVSFGARPEDLQFY